MEIYIIRHGETKANQERIFQGWLDSPLNEFGIELAKEAGKGLNNIHFDIAYTSSLSRAKETCEIILRETSNTCPVIIDDRIKEINMGILEGKQLANTSSEYERNLISLFFDNPFKLGTIPNGESIQNVIDRTQDFIKEIAKLNYERILVASHGCAIRCMLNFLYEDKDIFWHNRKVPANCCINILNVENSKISLIGDDVLFYDKQLLVDRFPLEKK